MSRRYRVVITDAAKRDIELIHDYVEVHGSSMVADQLLRKFLAQIDSLVQFPKRGATVSGLEAQSDELRQFLVGVYRGIYLIEDDVVLIIAVVDGRRNIQPLLERRLLSHDN